MKIKVQGSVLQPGASGSQDDSIIKENQDLKASAKNAYSYFFYAYLIICSILVVIQMSPAKKI